MLTVGSQSRRQMLTSRSFGCSPRSKSRTYPPLKYRGAGNLLSSRNESKKPKATFSRGLINRAVKTRGSKQPWRTRAAASVDRTGAAARVRDATAEGWRGTASPIAANDRTAPTAVIVVWRQPRSHWKTETEQHRRNTPMKRCRYRKTTFETGKWMVKVAALSSVQGKLAWRTSGGSTSQEADGR
eukprot:6185847-Pleurochrysis_carterae.AAC.2